MFSNAGKKIKKFAEVSFWIGIVFSFIYGLAMLVAGIILLADAFHTEEIIISICLMISSIFVMIGGSLISWFYSLVFYGQGEQIENISKIEQCITNKELYENTNNLFSDPTLKKCSQCYSMIPADAEYCTKCGIAFSGSAIQQKVCPSCGETISEKNIYCSKCGYMVIS